MRDAPDNRDRLYVPNHALVKALPRRVDLRSFAPPIYTQAHASCTANAVGAALQFNQIKSKQISFIPSTLFIYYNTRVLDGTEAYDSGGSNRAAIKSVVKFGTSPIELWDNSSGPERPCDEAYIAAHLNIVTGYARVQQNLTHIKACLAEGYPFVFGCNLVGHALETSDVLDMPTQEQIAAVEAGAETVAGHTMLAMGYDDDLQLILFRNSWGPEWGLQGHGVLPYGYIQSPKLASDFWTIRSETGTPA